MKAARSVSNAVHTKLLGVANGTFPLRLGTIRSDIYGGPYKKKPFYVHGIKMAEEIRDDCLISIPTQDFSTPNPERFMAGLYCAIAMAQQNKPLWVGCMGGIGRTGLFFGGLAKVMARYKVLTHKKRIDPILFVREHYIPHAIETQGQKRFLDDLDVEPLVQWVRQIQKAKPKPLTNSTKSR